MDFATAAGLPDADVAVQLTVRVLLHCVDGPAAGTFGSVVINVWSDRDVDSALQDAEAKMLELASERGHDSTTMCGQYYAEVQQVMLGHSGEAHDV